MFQLIHIIYGPKEYDVLSPWGTTHPSLLSWRRESHYCVSCCCHSLKVFIQELPVPLWQCYSALQMRVNSRDKLDTTVPLDEQYRTQALPNKSLVLLSPEDEYLGKTTQSQNLRFLLQVWPLWLNTLCSKTPCYKVRAGFKILMLMKLSERLSQFSGNTKQERK